MPHTTPAKTARRVTVDEAAGLVESGMWLDYGATLCQPDVFVAFLLSDRSGVVAGSVIDWDQNVIGGLGD